MWEEPQRQKEQAGAGKLIFSNNREISLYNQQHSDDSANKVSNHCCIVGLPVIVWSTHSFVFCLSGRTFRSYKTA